MGTNQFDWDDTTDKGRFGQLLLAGHPCISINTFEEKDALDIVRNCAVDLGLDLWLWSVNTGIRDGLVANHPGIDKTDHPAAALYHLAQEGGRVITVMLDLAGHLKDERTLRVLRDVIQTYERTGGHLVLIDHEEQLPSVVRATATAFELSLPDEAELGQILRSTLRKHSESRMGTVDLSGHDLATVVKNLRGLNRRQAGQIILDAVCVDQQFNINDINLILARKRRALQGEGLLEYIEAPVSLDEIGGLRRLKYWLEERRNTQTPDAAEFGLQAPRGILMLGVQGAGKSLAAKAVATAWHWPLLRMDVGAMYDRYIGESERRLRESLHQAERMAPMVLWIDEIEKAFASAASQSTDGGLSRRMFGNLLTWMQEHTSPAFIIATANDIEALPLELLRKGRFDEIFFVDLPVKDAREQILAIHLRKRKRDPADFDLEMLADACEGFSGAEIEQAIIAALHNAFAAGKELGDNLVVEAFRSSPPLSVTMAERVAALRIWAHGRCVPAD